MAEEGKRDRYPGLKAFEPADSDLFFGRNIEVLDLNAQLKANRLVVLFAKSGIGKSSLINAGLIPSLDDELFQSIKVRLQNVEIDPVTTLKNELTNYLDGELLARRANQDQASVGLWEYFRACNFGGEWPDGKIPVIIFDQFEEFFEHDKEVRGQLIVEIADLIGERLPKRIQTSLREIPFAQRTEEDLAWHSPFEVRILMAIRSDRLSLLDDLKKEIPIILHNRFQLKPLDRDSAKEAIVEPALLEDETFTSPVFTYNPQTLENMLNYLSNEEGEIESFQLQLLCQHIEKKVKAEQT